MIKTHHPAGRLAFWLLCSCLLLSSCGKPDYTDHLGNRGQFSDFNGQWLIINYWATWCKPCREEIPELNQLANSPADTVVVMGVDYDQNSGQQLQDAIAKLNIQFPVLTGDPATLLGYQRPQVLPTTLIFNPQGQLVQTLLGPQTRQSLLAALTTIDGIQPSPHN